MITFKTNFTIFSSEIKARLTAYYVIVSLITNKNITMQSPFCLKKNNDK